MGKNSKADERDADLLRVKAEIEETKSKLRQLVNLECELRDRAKERRWAEEKRRAVAKHALEVEMLRMAASGMSVMRIAKAKNVCKNTLHDRLRTVWRKEFPAHFQASLEALHRRNMLEVLREAPPPFERVGSKPGWARDMLEKAKTHDAKTRT